MASLLKRKGIKYEYESCAIPYILKGTYKPDWKVGKGLFLETKGKFDYRERRKLLAVVNQNPDKEIRVVFQRNNKISRASSTTYGDWCDKHDIKWSVFPELPVKRSELT